MLCPPVRSSILKISTLHPVFLCSQFHCNFRRSKLSANDYLAFLSSVSQLLKKSLHAFSSFSNRIWMQSQTIPQRIHLLPQSSVNRLIPGALTTNKMSLLAPKSQSSKKVRTVLSLVDAAMLASSSSYIEPVFQFGTSPLK